MNKSLLSYMFDAQIEGDIAHAKFVSECEGDNYVLPCAININSGEVDVILPPFFDEPGNLPEAIEKLRAAISTPDKQYVAINESVLPIAKDLMFEKGGLRRVESLEGLHVALGLKKFN